MSDVQTEVDKIKAQLERQLRANKVLREKNRVFESNKQAFETDKKKLAKAKRELQAERKKNEIFKEDLLHRERKLKKEHSKKATSPRRELGVAKTKVTAEAKRLTSSSSDLHKLECDTLRKEIADLKRQLQNEEGMKRRSELFFERKQQLLKIAYAEAFERNEQENIEMLRKILQICGFIPDSNKPAVTTSGSSIERGFLGFEVKNFFGWDEGKTSDDAMSSGQRGPSKPKLIEEELRETKLMLQEISKDLDEEKSQDSGRTGTLKLNRCSSLQLRAKSRDTQSLKRARSVQLNSGIKITSVSSRAKQRKGSLASRKEKMSPRLLASSSAGKSHKRAVSSKTGKSVSLRRLQNKKTQRLLLKQAELQRQQQELEECLEVYKKTAEELDLKVAKYNMVRTRTKKKFADFIAANGLSDDHQKEKEELKNHDEDDSVYEIQVCNGANKEAISTGVVDGLNGEETVSDLKAKIVALVAKNRNLETSLAATRRLSRHDWKQKKRAKSCLPNSKAIKDLYMGKAVQGQQIKQLAEKIQHDVDNEVNDHSLTQGSQIVNHATIGQHAANGEYTLSSGRKASAQVQKFMNKYRRYSAPNAPLSPLKKPGRSSDDSSQHDGALVIKLPEAVMLKPVDALKNLYQKEGGKKNLMSPHNPRHNSYDYSRDSYMVTMPGDIYNLADKENYNIVHEYLAMLTDRSIKEKKGLGRKQWKENDDSDLEAVSKRSESGGQETPSVLSDVEGDIEDAISVLSEVSDMV